MRNLVRMTRRNLEKLAMAAAFALSAVPALAVPINVVNHSFETLPAGGLPNGCGAGCAFSVNDPIPGWTSIGGESWGQFQPGTQAGTTTYFSSLSDGITHAYSNGGTHRQTVGVTVDTGAVYTLLVDIGDRNDLAAAGSVSLLINGIHYSGVGAFVPGGWGTFTATYTGLAADDGMAIDIVLSSGHQGNFDNVRLSGNTVPSRDPIGVPEPMTLSLLGAGLAGIGMARRRRG